MTFDGYGARGERGWRRLRATLAAVPLQLSVGEAGANLNCLGLEPRHPGMRTNLWPSRLSNEPGRLNLLEMIPPNPTKAIAEFGRQALPPSPLVYRC